MLDVARQRMLGNGRKRGPLAYAGGASDGGVMRTLPPIVLAAVGTAVCMYPVDLARALMMGTASGQSQSLATLLRNFVNTHGVAGLFKQGLGPEVGRASAMVSATTGTRLAAAPERINNEGSC